MAGPVKHEFNLKTGEKLTKIFVKYGKVIHGIGFQKADNAGKVYPIEWFNGTDDDIHDPITTDEVKLDNDFLTHISGTYGPHRLEGTNNLKETCIITMRIHTNVHPGGLKLYGEERESSEITPFSSPLPTEGSVVGFFGWTEHFLGNIGIYTSGNKIEQSGVFGDKDSEINWYIKLKEGDQFSTVKFYHGNIVDGIGFDVKNDLDTYSLMFTGSDKNPQETPVLDASEVITKVSGFYGWYTHNETEKVTIQIAEIWIHTNSNPGGYGPFGDANEVDQKTPFSFPEKEHDHSKIVGLYGSYGMFLNSIGFTYQFPKDTAYGPYGRKIEDKE